MLHRSTSSTFNEGDPFGSLSESGADLSRYQEQLTRERNSRTLNLRRHSNHPQIHSIVAPLSSQNKILDVTKFPILDPDKAVEVVQSGSEAQIETLNKNLMGFACSQPKMLSRLLHSTAFLEELSGSIGSGYSVAATLALIQTIEIVFPLCGSMANAFVDGGMCFAMPDLLQSGNPALVMQTIELIGVISGKSYYARDAVLCMDIHKMLIEIAKQMMPLTKACCECLLAMFTTPGSIEGEILIEAARLMFELLTIDSCEVISLIMDCYVEMSNKYNALVSTFYELGMFPLAVQLLDNEGLVASGLRLIGNLCIAQPSQIRVMLDVGLLPKLVVFMESEFASDAFWVMSNLLEVLASEILPLIGDGAVRRVLEIIDSSSYDVQKEAAYFLSTLIWWSSDSVLPKFMVPPILDVIVNMLGCGVPMVVSRCMCTLMKFGKYVRIDPSKRNEFVSYLAESDLRDRLDEILDEQAEFSQITDMAQAMLAQYNYLTGADG